MFALDSLVRSAVSAAIGVLSPELGAHLGPDTASVAGQELFQGIFRIGKDRT